VQRAGHSIGRKFEADTDYETDAEAEADREWHFSLLR
jgi:hypothetical protein